MKKALSLILALVLVLSLSITAFAAEDKGNKPGENTNIDVNVEYADEVETINVYHVDLTWDDMIFTYSVTGTKTWDAEKHEYVTSAEGSWDKTTADITATNHSDKAVTMGFRFDDADANDGVNGVLSVTTKELASAVDKAVAEADSVTTTLTISGEAAASGKVGSITITIAG